MVWGWLFILSACSYMVDYVGLQGYLRWSLILIFMMLKAGLIVAVFMHMAWERLALVYAIILPPVLVLVFVAMMVFESDYTLLHPADVLRRRALTGCAIPAPAIGAGVSRRRRGSAFRCIDMVEQRHIFVVTGSDEENDFRRSIASRTPAKGRPR